MFLFNIQFKPNQLQTSNKMSNPISRAYNNLTNFFKGNDDDIEKNGAGKDKQDRTGKNFLLMSSLTFFSPDRTTIKYNFLLANLAGLLNSVILSKNIADIVALATADELPFSGLQIVLYVFEGVSLALFLVLAVMIARLAWKAIETKRTSKVELSDTHDNNRAWKLVYIIIFITLAEVALNIAIDCIRATIFGNVF